MATRFAGDKLYEIQKGDTLYSLASRHGTTVDALASANNITDINNISIGQSLNLGSMTSPQPIQDTPSGLSPERRATLDTLSWAEGTWNDDTQSPNYAMRFGDARNSEGSLDITKPHPLDARPSPWGGSSGSNASGAYQFLDSTWREENDGQNAVMSPANQDRSASQLIDQTGWDDDAGFRDQAHKLSGRWASIPNQNGVSNYNQPVKDVNELDSFYQERVEHYSAPPPPEPAPPVSAPNEPIRPFGSEAVLNGKPVMWGGKDYGWQSPSSFETITPPAPTPKPQPAIPSAPMSVDAKRNSRRGTAFR